jgi:inner membrane protein
MGKTLTGGDYDDHPKKKPFYARLALVSALVYLSISLVQHNRAIAGGFELAAQRGHQPTQLEAKPIFRIC